MKDFEFEMWLVLQEAVAAHRVAQQIELLDKESSIAKHFREKAVSALEKYDLMRRTKKE